MKWSLKIFEELTNDDLYSILQLRSEIFVVEQNCAYQDLDGMDKIAHHLFLEDENKMIAYARLLPSNTIYESPSIGRVVVREAYRHRNLGKELMNKAKQECARLFNTKKITISAQVYLIKFYNDIGFSEEGESYLEDNIPHIKMKSGF